LNEYYVYDVDIKLLNPDIRSDWLALRDN
jgi:hypothetical protein